MSASGIIVISSDEYMNGVCLLVGSLTNPYMFKDSTRCFDRDHIASNCGINKQDIKKILITTNKNPLYSEIPNELVKYHCGECETDFPTGDVVIVVKNESKSLENRVDKYGAQKRFNQWVKGENFEN